MARTNSGMTAALSASGNAAVATPASMNGGAMRMVKVVAIPALILFVTLTFAGTVRAADAAAANPYSGDLWQRSTLSGDWGGLRNEWAAKGVTVDMTLTQAALGIVHGGKDTGWQYGGGRGNIFLNFDTQRLGLWSGGSLAIEAEGNFIPQDSLLKTINGKTGALMPVNSNQLYPMPSGDNFNVPQVALTQFFSSYLAASIGKLDTTSGDANEFAHGKGDTQFMNLAFNFNAVPLVTTPYSTLGAGLILFPTKDPREGTVNLMVLQTNGQASRSGLDDLDANQLTFAGEGRIRTHFFGLTGHHLFGAAYSNRKFTSLDQSLRLVVENREIDEKKGSWVVWYNFDQYVYEPEKGSGRGAGIFGRFGISDGNPNLMHHFYSVGVGGKGVIPGRPLDRFGIGFYYLDVKSPEFRGLRRRGDFSVMNMASRFFITLR